MKLLILTGFSSSSDLTPVSSLTESTVLLGAAVIAACTNVDRGSRKDKSTQTSF